MQMTRFEGQRAYALLEKLNFVRASGSEAEARAAEVIAAELKKCGLEARIETFPVWTYEAQQAEVRVTCPYGDTIEAAVVGLTGSTPTTGVTGDLVFVETGEEEFLEGIEGKIALTYGFLGAKKYERLTKAKPLAVICVGEAGKELTHLSIWDNYFKRFGKLPSVAIRYEDGLKLLKAGAKQVTVICEQQETEGESRNVVVTIPGTSQSEQTIALGGHFDTVPCTTGAHDNAGGSVILMELARIFAENPPRRTLQFIWFGAEELGLFGSQAYVKEHEKELENLQLLINIDVAGGILGRNSCTVTGPEPLRAYADALGKEMGIGLSTRLGIMSSDGLPFGDKGVPSLNIARSGGGTTFLHTPGDSLEHCGPEPLAMLGEYVEIFVKRIANAKAFPFKKEIPESAKKDIARYKEEAMGEEKKKD